MGDESFINAAKYIVEILQAQIKLEEQRFMVFRCMQCDKAQYQDGVVKKVYNQDALVCLKCARDIDWCNYVLPKKKRAKQK